MLNINANHSDLVWTAPEFIETEDIKQRPVRGPVKLKKIREKLELARTHPPTPNSFFLNMFKINTQKTHEKNRVGA